MNILETNHVQGSRSLSNDSYLNGLQRGQHEGRLEGILLALQVKFGTNGLKLYPMIAKIQNPQDVRAVIAAISVLESAEELRGFCLTLTKEPSYTSQGCP